MFKTTGILVISLALVACESQNTAYTQSEYCEALTRQIHENMQEYTASDQHLQQLEQRRLQQLYTQNKCESAD